MPYKVICTHPDTNSVSEKFFENVNEVCKFLEIKKSSFYKVQNGSLKCNSLNTKRWNYIKIEKLISDSAYQRRKNQTKEPKTDVLLNKFFDNLNNMKENEISIRF